MTIYENVPQDIIKFELTFETGLQLDTIRMTVPVNYAQLGHESAAEMMTKVKDALKRFIGDADWNFSSIRRLTGNDNIERVTMEATARVKTGEDADLKQRIENINTRGLTLGMPTVDYTFPLAYLNEHRAKLRKQILEAAATERAGISAALGKQYRLHEVRFSPADEWDAKDGRLSAYINTASAGQTRAAPKGGGETIHSEKMFMSAEITLAVVVPVGNA